MSAEAEIRNAAEDTQVLAERPRPSGKRAARGDRTGGAPVAPTGVPKGDHVAHPREADARAARVDAARDIGGEPTDFGDTGRP